MYMYIYKYRYKIYRRESKLKDNNLKKDKREVNVMEDYMVYGNQMFAE